MTKAIKYYLVTLETKKGKREARQKLVELLDQRQRSFFGKKSFYALLTGFHRENRKYQQVTKTYSEAYSEPCQTSEMELFPKIIYSFL